MKMLNEKQLDDLEKALGSGAPLKVALAYAKVPYKDFYKASYMASVAEETQAIMNGDPLAEEQGAPLIVGMVRHEPTVQDIERYAADEGYRAECDEAKKAIDRLSERYSECIIYHLVQIRAAGRDRRINATPSFWFLEHATPEFFGGPRASKAEDEQKQIHGIKVEFVDPKGDEDRIKAMEDEILSGRRAAS